MREIKFRVWLSEDEQYIVPGDCLNDDEVIWEIHGNTIKIITNQMFDTCPGGRSHVQEYKYAEYDGEYTIEQFTGLKDKNGVEIYESDIVRTTQSKTCAPHTKVEYRDGGFLLQSIKHKIVSYELSGAYLSHYEVIGNIHEPLK